jgi:hypothetical protein
MRIASIADRRASFAPHAHSRVEAEPLAEFLARRTAFVIGGDGLAIVLPVKSTRACSGQFAIRAVASRFSTAAAIDTRGYFLTASHAFEKKAPFIAYYRKNRIQIIPSRVVWRGNFAKGEPDLAVLCVPDSSNQFSSGPPIRGQVHSHSPPDLTPVPARSSTLLVWRAASRRCPITRTRAPLPPRSFTWRRFTLATAAGRLPHRMAGCWE